MTAARRILLACCLAQLMVTLDSSILSVALASLRRDLGLRASELPWAVNAFAIPLASLLLFAGRLSDRYGARGVLAAGGCVFAAASLLAGLATSPGILFAGRAVQGAGAALMSTAGLALLSRTFPNGPSRAKAFGLWAAAAGSGGAIGVIAGGIIVDRFGWRWTLLINVPIAAILLALLASVPAVAPVRRPTLNLPSTIAFAVTVTSVVVAVSRVGRSDGSPWLALAIGSAGTAAFLAAEYRSQDPLIPPEARRNLSLWLPTGGMFFVGAAMTCVFYFEALTLQTFHQLTPLATGCAFLPLSLGAFVGAASGHLLHPRIGVGATALLGTSIMVLALGAMGLAASVMTPALLIVSGGVVGVGMGIALASISDATTAALPAAQAGAASGLLTTAQQVGAGVGLAVAATLDVTAPSPWYGTGWAVTVVLAAIALGPLTPVAATRTRARRRSGQESTAGPAPVPRPAVNRRAGPDGRGGA